MPKSTKSLALTPAQHAALVAAALKCGYRVKRGPDSQLAIFVTLAAEVLAASGHKQEGESK